jgi:hypothetical protein
MRLQKMSMCTSQPLECENKPIKKEKRRVASVAMQEAYMGVVRIKQTEG